jgi:hypothetical protein
MNGSEGMWPYYNSIVVTGNTVTNNGHGGIGYDDYGNTIAKNLVVKNGGNGIGITDNECFSCLISDNIVKRNTGEGIFEIVNCLVKLNDVRGNTGNGINAENGASDSYGSLIKGNVSKGNGDGATTFDLNDDDPPDDFWKKNKFGTKSW